MNQAKTNLPNNRRQAWLRVSPEGKRSGFISLADGRGGAVTVTILPKMWSMQPAVTRFVEHIPGTTTHVAAHELDFLRIASSSDSLNSVVFGLTEITGVGERQLLEMCRPPSRLDRAPGVSGNPFAGLLDLMNLADRCGARRSDEVFAGRLERSFTRVIVYERFLTALQPVLFRARPRYIEVTDELTNPRGRLDDTSLLLSEAIHRPWVKSTFDELTMDTPLLRVMRAALVTIAADRLPKAIQVLARDVDVRATQFARHLSHVTLISQDRALLIADRLHLSAVEKQWEPALESARDVLRQFGPTPAEGAHVSESFAIHVFTEKFWEQTVARVLTTAFRRIHAASDNNAPPEVSAPQPWKRVASGGADENEKGTYPDYMFRVGTGVVLADAKYKWRNTIAVADGYQLFAYSHLAALKGVLSDFGVIVYPGAPRSTPSQRRWTRRLGEDYTVWTVRLPFPSARDLHSSAAWNQYIAGTAASLTGLASDWLAALSVP